MGFIVASRVAAAVKAKFTTVQTPVASTLEGQGGGTARIPPGARLRRSCSLHADPLMRAPHPHHSGQRRLPDVLDSRVDHLAASG